MDSSPTILGKIRSTDLRNEAVAEAPQSRVVIVELDLPAADLEMASVSGDRFGSSRPRFRPGKPSGQTLEMERRITDTSNGIERITGKPPETFLSTSKSFIVEANGEQIGRIAEMPSVSAIWPNTRRVIEGTDVTR